MKEEFRDKIVQFPHAPGVYLMKGEGGKIIYVGKAKDLNQRIRSYFSKEADARYQIQFLLKRLIDLDYLVTQNEKEALLLENSLIKKHKPKYNISLRDDKTYVSLRLSVEHPFPRLTVTRRIRKDGALYFGPYAVAAACRETVDFLQRHFKLRSCSDLEFSNRSRPCIEYQIKRCTAPCVSYVGQTDYLKEQVTPVRLFLEGHYEALKKELKQRMEEAAEKEHFEQAVQFRNLLQHIDATLEKQNVVMHGGGHEDVIYLLREGMDGVFSVLHVREGSLVDSRSYPTHSLEEDTQLMEHFLSQYYLSNPFIPDTIVLSLPIPHPETLLEILSEKKGKKVQLLVPKRGDRLRLLLLAQSNAKLKLDQLIRHQFQMKEVLEDLQKALGLAHPPHRMECYDISNISGKEATGSRVVFIEGAPDKKFYRHYKIRMKNEPNDYGMMREVLERRFKKGKQEAGSTKQDDPNPDLLIIDGGKGHLNTAQAVLHELGQAQISVISIAKGKGAGARAKGLWKEKKEEEIYLPNRKNPLILKRGSPELMLLQRIRDEAHRFALQYHRKLRDQKRIPLSRQEKGQQKKWDASISIKQK